MIEVISAAISLAIPVCVYLVLRDRKSHREIVANLVKNEYDVTIRKEIKERCDHIFNWENYSARYSINDRVMEMTSDSVAKILATSDFYDTLVKGINRKQVGK